MLQVDGVCVLGRAADGRCKGTEVKTAAFYPYYQPSERYLLAEVCEASDFRPLVAGLLREAGVRQDDELVVVCDRAGSKGSASGWG